MDLSVELDFWSATTIPALLVALCAFACVYARWNYGTLESANLAKHILPVIRPYFMFGSDPFAYRVPIQEQDLAWTRKYGRIFAGYEGRAPVVYVTDPELIRRIFVRDTDHFYDRRHIETGIPALDEQLDFMPGEKWKRVRSAVTPLFTLARLRQFSRVLNELAEEGVRDLGTNFGKVASADASIKLNPREFVIPILVQMIARCFLGISVEDWKNPDNEMIQVLKKLAGEDFQPSFWNTTLLQTFPFLRPIWAKFTFPGGLGRIVRILEHLLKVRSGQNEKEAKADLNMQPKDLVDVMVAMMNKVGTVDADYKRLDITKDTVLTRGWSAFIPGYETMALVFTMCAYHFAKNPDVQERAAAEVKGMYAKLEKEGNTSDLELDAQTLAVELPYLSACIQEVLRLNPAFSRPERMCNRDWTSHDDEGAIRIKKGTNVVLLTWAANRNPEHFPDPEKFVPERWLGENRDRIHPFAFTSFGFGHRNCVGQRLGVFVPKLIMCRFLKKFLFQERVDTVSTLKPGSPALVRYDPFYVDVVRRDRDDELARLRVRVGAGAA